MANKPNKQAPKKDEPKVNSARADRAAAQNKRHLHNIELRKQGLPTPWMQAQAARAERRRGLAPQERTPLGNIIVLGADGIKRVKPGSKREMEALIDLRQRERAEASTERRKPAKRAKKVKTA